VLHRQRDVRLRLVHPQQPDEIVRRRVLRVDLERAVELLLGLGEPCPRDLHAGGELQHLEVARGPGEDRFQRLLGVLDAPGLQQHLDRAPRDSRVVRVRFQRLERVVNLVLVEQHVGQADLELGVLRVLGDDRAERGLGLGVTLGDPVELGEQHLRLGAVLPLIAGGELLEQGLAVAQLARAGGGLGVEGVERDLVRPLRQPVAELLARLGEQRRDLVGLFLLLRV
jgi:hypothetical protein